MNNNQVLQKTRDVWVRAKKRGDKTTMNLMEKVAERIKRKEVK